MDMSVIDEFAQLCRDEADLVSRLVVLLEQEQALLIQGEEYKLEALADSKSAVLDELAQQSSCRGKLMGSLGVQDRDTLYIWLADKPRACEAWTALEDAVNRAQSINHLNGSFVNARLALVEKSLLVLRTAAAATLGYDRGGNKPEVVTGRRLLGSA